MKEINDCLSLPIIALDTSEEIGVLTHFITDPVANRIIGFALTTGEWYSERKALLFPDVSAFGVDAVIVRAANAVRPITQVSEIQAYINEDREKRIRQAISASGQSLGTLADWAFDERTAEVNQFRLERPNGEDVVLVPRNAFVRSGKAVVILDSTLLPSNGSPHSDGPSGGGYAGSGTVGGGAATAERTPPANTATGARATGYTPSTPVTQYTPTPSPAPPTGVSSFLERTPAPVETPAVASAPVAEAPAPQPASAPVETAPVAAAPPVSMPTPPVEEPPAILSPTSTLVEEEPIVEEPVSEAVVDEEPALAVEAPAEEPVALAPEPPAVDEAPEETVPAAVSGAETTTVIEITPQVTAEPEEEAATDDLTALEEPIANGLTGETPILEEEPEEEVAFEETVLDLPEEEPVAAPASATTEEQPVAEQLKEAINRNKDGIIPFVVGKYADRDIADDQGNRIVAQGQQITLEIASSAHRAWKLYDLWIAAQTSPAGDD